GAFGPHVQRARLVDRRDAAATGADLRDVDHRNLDRQRLRVASDERGAARQGLAAVDDAGLGGGAAHVERNRLLEPERTTQRTGADHAGGGTRLEHAHALLLRLLRFVQPPGRLHEQELAAESRLRDVLVDAAHVLAHARADVGVRRDGRAALELAVFARELVRGGDERARQARLDDRLHARLVRGVDVTVEQHD